VLISKFQTKQKGTPIWQNKTAKQNSKTKQQQPSLSIPEPKIQDHSFFKIYVTNRTKIQIKSKLTKPKQNITSPPTYVK